MAHKHHRHHHHHQGGFGHDRFERSPRRPEDGAARADAVFAKLDKNGDGVLSREEFAAAMQARRHHGGQGAGAHAKPRHAGRQAGQALAENTADLAAQMADAPAVEAQAQAPDAQAVEAQAQAADAQAVEAQAQAADAQAVEAQAQAADAQAADAQAVEAQAQAADAQAVEALSADPEIGGTRGGDAPALSADVADAADALLASFPRPDAQPAAADPAAGVSADPASVKADVLGQLAALGKDPAHGSKDEQQAIAAATQAVAALDPADPQFAAQLQATLGTSEEAPGANGG